MYAMRKRFHFFYMACFLYISTFIIKEMWRKRTRHIKEMKTFSHGVPEKCRENENTFLLYSVFLYGE